jgi:hypothetical protein
MKLSALSWLAWIGRLNNGLFGAAPDKWLVFVMSLVVPGSGQLAAGHVSCLAWFGIAGLVVALHSRFGDEYHGPMGWLSASVWIVLAIVSAEHAKRCLEPRGCRTIQKRIVCRQMSCHLPGDRVSMRVVLAIARPVQELWLDVADFTQFLCVDPFHSRVTVLAKAMAPGVDLAIEHRAFGLSLMRFGRLLMWREGCGYAFSDISARGPSHGFPHVFFVNVASDRGADGHRSVLTIDVRGKWTARYVPRLLRACWLKFVMAEHARLIAAYLSLEK